MPARLIVSAFNGLLLDPEPHHDHTHARTVLNVVARQLSRQCVKTKPVITPTGIGTAQELFDWGPVMHDLEVAYSNCYREWRAGRLGY